MPDALEATEPGRFWSFRKSPSSGRLRYLEPRCKGKGCKGKGPWNFKVKDVHKCTKGRSPQELMPGNASQCVAREAYTDCTRGLVGSPCNLKRSYPEINLLVPTMLTLALLLY